MKSISMVISAMVSALVCGCAPQDPVSSATGELVVGQQVLYDLSHAVPIAELDDLPTDDPAALGGEVLEGDPRIAARFDLLSPTESAGVFQVTRGVLRVYYPFTEHATIMTGVVRVTDEAGVSHLYTPGDSYLIPQDSVMLVDVQSDVLQKSFLNFRQ